mmetsp:Transcript_12902/g.41353  ORF Transcript_12902/g.41353 Transcript_12902/m.41353 type:complete len:253 (-) Transcript_12902:94-852(-)
MPLGAPCAPLFLRAAADQPFPRRSAPKASGSDTVGEPAEPRSTRVPAARPGWVGWKQALPSSIDARARAIPATPAAATLITITIPEEPSSAISRAGTSDGANAGGRAADAAVAAPAAPAPRSSPRPVYGASTRTVRWREACTRSAANSSSVCSSCSSCSSPATPPTSLAHSALSCCCDGSNETTAWPRALVIANGSASGSSSSKLVAAGPTRSAVRRPSIGGRCRPYSAVRCPKARRGPSAAVRRYAPICRT